MEWLSGFQKKEQEDKTRGVIVKYILLELLILLFQIGVVIFTLVQHLPIYITLAALIAIVPVVLLIDMIVKQRSINLR